MADLLCSLSGVQKDAVTACGTDLIVNAGAGAGKTRVLVSRYLHFHLDKGLDLGEILAITFTEKAAAEMQDRVRDKLTELGRNPEGLDTAYISTFHSFCLRVLREFPALARLDPEFGVLDDLQSKVLLYQAIRGQLAKGLKSSPPDEDIAVLAAGLTGGVPSKLIPVLSVAYNHWRESGLPLAEIIFRSGRCDLDELAEAKARVAQAVASLAAEHDNAPKQARGKICRLVEHWQSDSEDLLHRAAGLLDYGSKAKAVAEHFESVHSAARELVALAATAAAKPVAEALGRLLEKVHSDYSAAKERENALDFADMMLKGRELFAHPIVQNALRRRFKAVLVDEYQDTNGLQKELVDLIREPNTLFVVGDPKQSIYRFRGAEVEVFAQTAIEIVNSAGRVIHLDENYRSRGELMGFHNAFFGSLFPSACPGSVGYEPIRGMRPQGELPRVELLTGLCDQNSLENRRLEAQAIAGRIREMVSAGERLAWEKDDEAKTEQPRSVRYGDITLLFRSRTDISIYYEALLSAGIPAINLAGSDFFLRREVADLLAVLRAVADPQDEYAIAVALRSPLFGLSDPELWQVKTAYGSFCQAVKDDNQAGLICPKGLAEARSLLVELRPLALRVGPTFFVEKILAQTGYPQVVLAGSGGMQGFANLRKFQELVEDLEQAGLTDLVSFLDYMGEVSHTSGKESEAHLATEGEDAVRLMTIHGSKGLEFPVVFVVDGCRGIREVGFPPVLRFSKEEGFGFRLMVGGNTFATHQYEQISNLDALADFEEAKRIFYVAVTRAKDYLVLTGISKKDRRDKLNSVQDANNWMEWMVFLAAEYRSIWKRDILEYLEQMEAVEPAIQVANEIAPTADTTTYSVNWDAETVTAGVSDLLLLHSCPRRFYYRRILALPERSVLTPGVIDRIPGKISGVDPIIRGNLAHLVCAQLTAEADIDALLASGASELGVSSTNQDELTRQVKPLIAAYRASELFGRIGDSTRTASEEPFLVDLAGLRVSGTFDKLAFFPDGSGLLLDYKTNWISEAEVAAKTAYYDLQLQLYAAAVREMFDLKRLEVGIYYLVPGVYDAVTECNREDLVRRIGRLKRYLIPGPLQSYPTQLGECKSCPYYVYCQAQAGND